MWPLVLVQLPVCLLLTVLTPPSWHPWVQWLGVSACVAAATMSPVRRMPLPSRLPGAADRAVEVADLVGPDHDLVGCVLGERIATTAIVIEAGSDAVTELGSAAPDAAVGPDRDRWARVPLGVLADQFDVCGVPLEGVDVVVEARRAAPTDAGRVYSTVVGRLPLPATRRVLVLLRMDLTALGSGLADVRRHGRTGADAGAAGAVGDPVCRPPATTDHLVALATERVRRAVVHRGYACRVLEAVELADYHRRADHHGAGDRDGEETRGFGLVPDPSVDPSTVLDQLRRIPAEAVTEVIRIRRAARRGLMVVSTVAVHGIDPSVDSSTGMPRAAGRPLPGGRILPVPGESLDPGLSRSGVPATPERLAALAPPAHGCGQILGATASGRAVALSVAGPHLRSVLLAADPTVCRQIVFRAVASGLRLCVVSDTPARWAELAGRADPSELSVRDPESGAPPTEVDAIVWDLPGGLSAGRIDAFSRPGGADVIPPTVIRVIPTGTAETNADFDAAVADGPDLVLDGRIDGWLGIERPGAPPVSVRLVSVPQEQAMSDAGPGASRP